MLLVSPRVEAPRMEPHLPLQGSIKRKLEDDNSPASNALHDAIFPSDNKRLCLDDVTLSMGQGTNPVSCPDIQHSPFSTNHGTPSMGVAGHGMLLESNHMNGSGIGSPFSVPPNTEVGQKGPMGGHYDEKGSNMHSVDQELQDLLEELTKMPDPPPSELDLEKILGSKTEDSLGGLGHPQPSLSSPPKPSPQTPHLENPMANKDFSPRCNPPGGGSPQMRPASAGANYPLPSQNKAVASPISSTAASKSQTQSMLPGPLPNMTGPNWHAQQLKHLAASKQVPAPKHQAPSWPTISSQGLSPPYPQGSSPHHQPFSPQNVMVSGMGSNGLPGNNMQSPQNSLLSSIASSSHPSGGPSPPFSAEKLSSPVLNQQPFSPPNPILPNISSATIPTKSPQNNLLSPNTGPSPPYRPEKLSSPALHPQSFSPQSTLIPSISPASNPTSMQSTLFKSMAGTQSKSMTMMMQQSSNGLPPGLEGPVGQDQFSFNNTKPLSHFSSEPTAPQKMSPMASGSGQQSLIHYLQAATSQQQSQQVNNRQFLQQQLQQLMQPSRMQRHVQPAPLPSPTRQDQATGMGARLQEPGALPNAGAAASATGQTMVNGYTMRNHLLKQQIMRRQQQAQQQQQQLQEKQRHGMMGSASEQRGPFVGQTMNQFPAVSQPIATDCSQSMQTPPPNHRMMPSAQGILQNPMSSGITVNQNSGPMVMISHNPIKQAGMFPSNSDFNLLLRPGQNSLGMNSGCQTVHTHPAARPSMALSGFAAGSLVSQTSSPQHLRQSALPRIPSVYSSSSAQMWTPTGVPRMASQSPMDPSMQQFSNNPLFSKQNTRPNIPSQQFTHQAVAPPNQIAPGIQARQIQKVNLTQAGQSLGSLNNQSLRHNLTRGPMAASMNVMKPMTQGVSSFNQLNSAQAVGPPSYPASAGQSAGTFGRMNVPSELLPQYDFVPQPNSSVLPGNCSEADFIDSLMKSSGNGSTDEDWLNHLTMIDDILGHHVQSSGHV